MRAGGKQAPWRGSAAALGQCTGNAKCGVRCALSNNAHSTHMAPWCLYFPPALRGLDGRVTAVIPLASSRTIKDKTPGQGVLNFGVVPSETRATVTKAEFTTSCPALVAAAPPPQAGRDEINLLIHQGGQFPTPQ